MMRGGMRAVAMDAGGGAAARPVAHSSLRQRLPASHWSPPAPHAAAAAPAEARSSHLVHPAATYQPGQPCIEPTCQWTSTGRLPSPAPAAVVPLRPPVSLHGCASRLWLTLGSDSMRNQLRRPAASGGRPSNGAQHGGAASCRRVVCQSSTAPDAHSHLCSSGVDVDASNSRCQGCTV